MWTDTAGQGTTAIETMFEENVNPVRLCNITTLYIFIYVALWQAPCGAGLVISEPTFGFVGTQQLKCSSYLFSTGQVRRRDRV